MANSDDLKKIIVDIVKDSDVTINTINDDTILIGEDGLFFDSIDVLELIVEIEKKYGIKIKDNHIINEKFNTFKSLDEFITENAKK
ncbi:MAG: hypothetical protein A2086_11590 [Spirochaetes bacterium GWD1_27_9]|nr:MAG: hypothetical protein A2Z98_06295 [Spirochaetes bacterium GWB1_27_13]OHD21759.1 MAG: hypothetical protein A2Y34_12360 [Spirochaetes bacterium GWC1_27_15]OHD38078.1 MAG: hypothetical protein A2086_11590 [Spirochaetes bacterium GWD1_27_9]